MAPGVTPICPFFYECGGCDSQDLAYADQLAAKQAKLRELFVRTAPEDALWRPLLHSAAEYPIYFRNKIRFAFVEREGVYWPSRHQKGAEKADIAVNECFLQSPESVQIINFTARFAQEQGWILYDPITGLGWLKHLLIRQGKRTGEIMLVLVTNKGVSLREAEWIFQVTAAFPQVVSLFHSQTEGRDNSEITDRHLWGAEFIHETIGKYTFRISPHAFFQTNSDMVEALYEATRKECQLTGNEVVWDIYAGSATIGIYLSEHAKEVICIEMNPANIADAQGNTEDNAIGNVRMFGGDVDSVMSSQFLRQIASPDVIVVDPPRAGLSKRLTAILPHISKHRLVYVSCNPLTCRRDCDELVRQGYAIESIQGIDMFPHTPHCEMIVTLIKR